VASTFELRAAAGHGDVGLRHSLGSPRVCEVKLALLALQHLLAEERRLTRQGAEWRTVQQIGDASRTTGTDAEASRIPATASRVTG
jgi:hypothetical protein